MTIPFLEAETGFTWNEGAARYIGPTGRFVSVGSVRDALENVVDRVGVRVENLSNALIDGNISLADWQSQMTANVKTLHVVSSASARGGWAQMSPADWGWTGSEIKKQYQYLQNFANQVESGAQRLDGSLRVRAGMYVQAGRSTFEAGRRRHLNLSRQVIAERRVLGFADHCSTGGGLEGCLELAARGWSPPGTLPPIGVSPCRVNCRCSFEYRFADGTETR